jgi:hypothetical protein
MRSSLLSPVLHGIFRPLKRRLLECRAAAAARPAWPPLRIVHRPLPKTEGLTAIVIHKERSRIREIAGHVGWLETRNGFSTAWRRLGAILDLVADEKIDDGEWTADLGDWVRQPGPVIGFCSNRDESLLVPDRGFHASRGYERERQAAARAPAFTDRDPRIVWRGSPTGQGHAVADPLSPTDLTLVQRVRMCLLLREVPDPLRGHVDARIAVGRRMPRAQADAYGRAGIAGDHVAQASWCYRRYAIDIDGHANAFSNLFIRLLYGCCVIKVESPLGFRQWYYDRIEPWRHFVPVAADLSDLTDVIAWCHGHPRECGEIATAGQRVALEMTPATERAAAIRTLCAAHESDADDMVISLPSRDTAGDRRQQRRAA